MLNEAKESLDLNLQHKHFAYYKHFVNHTMKFYASENSVNK